MQYVRESIPFPRVWKSQLKRKLRLISLSFPLLRIRLFVSQNDKNWIVSVGQSQVERQREKMTTSTISHGFSLRLNMKWDSFDIGS